MFLYGSKKIGFKLQCAIKAWIQNALKSIERLPFNSTARLGVYNLILQIVAYLLLLSFYSCGFNGSRGRCSALHRTDPISTFGLSWSFQFYFHRIAERSSYQYIGPQYCLRLIFARVNTIYRCKVDSFITSNIYLCIHIYTLLWSSVPLINYNIYLKAALLLHLLLLY